MNHNSCIQTAPNLTRWFLLLQDSDAHAQGFGSSVNQLWAAFQADGPSGNACVRRNLCEHVFRSHYDFFGYGTTLEALAL